MEYSSLFVSLMGMGTVFFGLACLIVLVTLMGRMFSHSQKQPDSVSIRTAVPSAPASKVEPINQELAVVIAAAIAEHMGTDAAGLRILSIKKI